MTGRGYRRYAVVLLVAASALHAYECFFLSNPPSLRWFSWGMLPYGWCVLAILLGTRGRAATVGAAVALAWDLTTHYSVFMGNHGSTAALALNSHARTFPRKGPRPPSCPPPVTPAINATADRASVARRAEQYLSTAPRP